MFIKTLTLPFLLLTAAPAPAAINCFTDGTVGVVLETGRQYVPVGEVRITSARADVYRDDGALLQSVPGTFVLWSDYAKTAIFDGIPYNFGRNWEQLPGNPFYLGWCGEDGTPPKP